MSMVPGRDQDDREAAGFGGRLLR